MAGLGDIYDPAAGIRGDVSTRSDKGGIGLGAEKNPTPTLRVFGSNLGNQWLMYGGIIGGTQDYVPSPEGSNEPAGCKWIRFYYGGLLEIDGEPVFGNWKVFIVGEGLEQVAHEVGKHVKTSLMVGEKPSGLHQVIIRSITIEPVKVKKLKDMEADEE